MARSGEQTKHNGIYLPDVDGSCAEFLSTKYDQAPSAIVLIRMADLLHPITREKYGEEPIFEKRKCVWYLEERAVDLDIAPSPPPSVTAQIHRVAVLRLVFTLRQLVPNRAGCFRKAK